MAVMPLVNTLDIRGCRVLIFAPDAQLLPSLRLAHSNLRYSGQKGTFQKGVAHFKRLSRPLSIFLLLEVVEC